MTSHRDSQPPRFVHTTKLHPDPGGNCMAAAWASLLGLPLNAVPEFENAKTVDEQVSMLKKWLTSLDLILLTLPAETLVEGFAIAFGLALKDPDFGHCAIYLGGQPYFDVAADPDDRGLERVHCFWTVVPVRPWEVVSR